MLGRGGGSVGRRKKILFGAEGGKTMTTFQRKAVTVSLILFRKGEKGNVEKDNHA